MQSPFRPIIPMESDRDLYCTYLDYILHRSGHQLTEAQCGAALGRDALALQAQLHNAPHDTDSVRGHIITTVETLLLTVNNTGITKFYCPHLLIAHLKEDPQILNRALSNIIQKILHSLSNKQEGSRIDNMANLLENVDCFIEAALKRGQFTNFDHLATLAMEYYNFWPILREQRAAYIANQPDYKYQLEQQSIFPLQYELVNNRDNPLARLIKVHGFHNKPTKYMTLMDINTQLNTMAHYVPDNQEPDSHNATNAAIARITGWPERKLNKHNSFTFLPLIATTIKPPTFSEA